MNDMSLQSLPSGSEVFVFNGVLYAGIERCFPKEAYEQKVFLCLSL